MPAEPWTIDRIRDALGHPGLAQRFLAEVNRAPAYELLTVFAKWERIAKDTLRAIKQGREIIDYVKRGEEPPGEWIDGTERLREAMARTRGDSRGEEPSDEWMER